MPLDPYVQGFLQKLTAANRPKLSQLNLADARQAYAGLAQVTDAKDVPIGKIEDSALAGPGGPLAFRVYTPAEEADTRMLPGLVFFHGGGFVLGSIDGYDGLCRLLANASGCRLISVDYRLGPEHRFPAAAEDAVVATHWVVTHAAALGVDADRIAIGGDSSGGNLAAMVCQRAKQNDGPKLALQVLLCPILTDANAQTDSRRLYAEGYFLEVETIKYFARHYYTPEADAQDSRISPLLADDLAGLPPAHIHTAEFDPLRDEGNAYAERLERAGVAVKYRCHDGMIHHFYTMAGINPNARKAIDEIGAAIKKALA